MTGLVVHPSSETETFFREALDRKTPLVVSFQDPEGWSSLKSRITAVDASRKSLTVERPLNLAGRRVTDIRRGQYLGVAFRRGHRKCLCSCVVIEADQDESCGAERNSGLTLSWPDTIQTLQRRAYYRVPLPPSMKVKALFWAGTLSDKPDNPGQDRSSIYADMVDISVGGMAVATGGAEECFFREDQTVSCEFRSPSGVPFSLEAHFKHQSHNPSGEQLLGFQFVGLEHGPQGRHRLTQLADWVHELSSTGRPRFNRSLPRRRPRV